MYCSGHSSSEWQTTCTYIRSFDNINGKQMVDKFVIIFMLWFSNCNQYFRKRPRPCRFWKMFSAVFCGGLHEYSRSWAFIYNTYTNHILTFGIPCNGELFFWKTLRCPVPGNPRDPTCRRLFSDTSNHGPSPGWTAVQSENVREVQYVCTFCIQSMYAWRSEYVHAVKYICTYM